ncbi:hypothetical protein AOCH_000659 [Aspergillus ochraceoroseus]|uniref:Amidohydrolase-related domain-containing protein n=2 Tax=Aspergillus ochraceoroseus TaxID=138278 RepID=A0A0F8U8P9_9EURO|nr:hypothetical protein AOCH_000659 [Aspergillus ochraceoroseus]
MATMRSGLPRQILRLCPSITPNPVLRRSQSSLHPSTQKKPLKDRLPLGTWDSHMHVVEPHYPVIANAAYKPTPHGVDEAIAFESSLGIQNVVLVQPSVFGFDNSCLLDALRHIGPSHGRGVVVIDPANIEAKTLAEWHSLGVRGVRVNFKSAGKIPSPGELERILLAQAQLVRPLGWVIQIHVSLDVVPILERIIPRLGVKVCLDHFGGPDPPTVKWEQGESFTPYTLPGFSALVSLLQAGQTYVKVSAPYRLSADEKLRDLESMLREFLHTAPNRVIYATDWPHTRFSGINIEPFTELCLRLCGSQPGLAERVFRRNAEQLMDEPIP